MNITETDCKKKKILNQVVCEMGGNIEECVKERDSYSIDLAGKKILLEHHIAITRNPYVGVISTKCKDVTCKLLVDASLPTPHYEGFYNKNYNEAAAYEKLNQMNYPIVLKKGTGSNSTGLFINILNSKQAIDILRKNLKKFETIIAQEMVYGKEYRILVLNDKVIAGLEMIHPYVVGDGISKLLNLIENKQNTTDRRTQIDNQLEQLVMKQGFSLNDVIPEGKTICVKENCCLAEGGETKDITDIIHKDVIDICVKASKVVGKHLVGIDIICNDISKKQSKESINILEINGKPDFYIHYNPNHGETRNVLKDILEFITK